MARRKIAVYDINNVIIVEILEYKDSLTVPVMIRSKYKIVTEKIFSSSVCTKIQHSLRYHFSLKIRKRMAILRNAPGKSV